MYLQNGKRILKIYRVQNDHAGRFSCTVQNSAGEARREYTIEVQGEIQADKLFSFKVTFRYIH